MSTRRAVLTVSQLTEQLREVVEERFPAVWVEGEVSNFRLYGSGHAYFTLKDEGAQLRAVLFRNRMRRLRFEPGDGQYLLAFGSLEVYAQRGEYQFVVELLEPRDWVRCSSPSSSSSSGSAPRVCSTQAASARCRAFRGRSASPRRRAAPPCATCSA